MRRNVGLLGLLVVLVSLTVGVVSDVAGGQVNRGLTASGDKRVAAALAEQSLQR